MTDAQRFLLSAAENARAYFDRKTKGMPPVGMYEDLTIGRTLTEAIDAVWAEEQARASADAQFTRAVREDFQKASGL